MLNISSTNFFTTENLNRLAEKRNDEKWISKQLDNPDALFIPIWQNKNLFNVSDAPVIVFLKKKDIKDFHTINNSITLIGELNGRIYFSISLDNYSGDIDKEYSGLGIFTPIRKYAALLNKDEASLIAYANAVNNWQRHHLFCGICGKKTILEDSGHRLVCSDSSCGHQSFPRTDPAIITLIYKDDKCLLVRQSHWQPGQYALVAGFVEPGESLESAVARETYEETGIELDDIKYQSSQPWPFPGSIMLGFTAKAVTDKITMHDNELEDAKWMTREDIKNDFESGKLKFPTKFSIAYKLFEKWFDTENKKLSELINK